MTVAEGDIRTPDEEPLALSNSIRLSMRQWLIVGTFTAFLIALASPVWKHFERFEVEPDYRMPYKLSNDYWLYERFAGLAVEKYDTVLLGDSVVWGAYATRHETLSHYLNKVAGNERFANLGLNGAHPLALAGLVEHYGSAIAGQNVVVQCNPLWLSSPKADLQDEKAPVENHPRLIPQFSPRVPALHEEVSWRLGVLVEERVMFSKWTNHLQQAYYDQRDIPSWTIDHPYENPLAPLAEELPPTEEGRTNEPVPWFKRGIGKQDYPWVEPDKSLQWPAFQRVVEVLQRRGNRVFVVVGPFNEHHLTPKGAEGYAHVKATIVEWLKAKNVPHAAPPPLPSDLYGDASHPLAKGYEILAKQLWSEPGFFK